MTITCPFHGWTFRNDGTLLKVKDPDGAGYPPNFDTDGSHDLTHVARFDSYRGFRTTPCGTASPARWTTR